MSDTLEAGLGSTANATPAAPATSPSAPTSTPVADKPTSFSDALAQADAAAGSAPATPETTTPEATTPAPAITEPPPVDPNTPVENAGPIPLERHKAALENARKKASEETEQRLQQQYAPALQVVQQLHNDVQTGTIEGWAQLTQEYVQHPTLGPQLRSFFGKMLGQRGQQPSQAAPPAEAAPELFVEQNGQKYFDPEKLPEFLDYRDRQRDAKAAQERQAQADAQRTKAEAIARFQHESQQSVKQRLDFWSQQPGFSDHKKAIGAKQKELFEQHGLDEWTALGLAYAQVVPALLQQKSTTDLQARAVAQAAGRTDNPAASAPAPPRRPRSAAEALAQQYTV